MTHEPFLKLDEELMFVICAGMFRSGSTWQYQVAGEILATAGRRAVGLGYLNPHDFDCYLEAPRVAGTFGVLKTHELHPTFPALLRDGKAKGLYSFRDLRDVVYSMAHQLGCSFTEVIHEFRVIDRALAADRFWRAQPNVLLQRYKDWMADNAAQVRGIAAILGVQLSDRDVTSISEKYSLPENRKRTADLARRLEQLGRALDDPVTASLTDRRSLLHHNHIRQARIGHWRDLATDDEKQVLAELCGPWLIQHGYETDYEWARAG